MGMEFHVIKNSFIFLVCVFFFTVLFTVFFFTVHTHDVFWKTENVIRNRDAFVLFT